MARVLFDYAASEDDELSIKNGDVVEVVKKDAQDGWWMVGERECAGENYSIMLNLSPGPTAW